MKIKPLFGKIPQYRRFSYTPRFYDPQEEERKEREERIRKELQLESEKKEDPVITSDYASRISGSFKSARRTASRQSDPSAALIRLIILTFLTVLLIAYFQFGNVALFGLTAVIPVYLYFKLRGIKKNT